MAVIRTKNNVPQVYVSESRDFQIFTRVLDFTQNALKYDIDSMLNILSTRETPEEYLDYLQSKVGFKSSRIYDDNTIRKALSAMPHIMRYKGSELGIEMCINTFLNIVGFRKGYTISIHNNDSYDYTIRIGIEGNEINTDILKDMLRYVIPTGYFVEFYFYTTAATPHTMSVFNQQPYLLKDAPKISTLSSATESPLPGDETKEDDTYGTVQLSLVGEEDSNNAQ